jgi:hypothetical protein
MHNGGYFARCSCPSSPAIAGLLPCKLPTQREFAPPCRSRGEAACHPNDSPIGRTVNSCPRLTPLLLPWLLRVPANRIEQDNMPPAASASCRNRVGPYRKPASPCSPGKPALPSRCGRVRANVRVSGGNIGSRRRAPLTVQDFGLYGWPRACCGLGRRGGASVHAISWSAEMPRHVACTAGFGTTAFSRDSRSCACPATTPRARANGARSRCKAARAMRRR